MDVGSLRGGDLTGSISLLQRDFFSCELDSLLAVVQRFNEYWWVFGRGFKGEAFTQNTSTVDKMEQLLHHRTVFSNL